MKEKVIGFEDVRPGDVVLFEACDTLGYLIAYLTDSDVEHSGFMYYDKAGEKDSLAAKQVIHQTTPVLAVSSLMEEAEGRNVYVRRLAKQAEDENFDMAPVIEAGKKYFERKAPYNWDELTLLGFYYLVSVVPFGRRFQERLVKEKELVEVVMDTFISSYCEMFQEGSMVCSQFVSTCFEEAGEDYKLVYKADANSRMFLKRMLAQEGVEDFVIQLNKDTKKKLTAGDLTKEQKSTYCSQFGELILSNGNTLSEGKEENLVFQEEFIESFMRMTGEIGLNFCRQVLPEWKDVEESSLVHILDAVIQSVNEVSSPADLKEDMENLVPVGVIPKS